MGLDQNDSQPIIRPSKKTTVVNPPTVAAVLTVMAFGARGTSDRGQPWARLPGGRLPSFPYEKPKY
jgi:hypothetical protein